MRGIVLNYRDVTDEREHAQTLRDIERRRQSLLEEIINAEGEQRSRIAGELHDDTIQVMIASLVELDRSERHLRHGDVEAARGADRERPRERWRRPPSAPAGSPSSCGRSCSRRPALGRRSVTWPTRSHRDTGAEVTVRTRLGRYPVDIETLAYRTIREALINVRRHAGAGNVTISVSERRGALHATVSRRRARLRRRTAAVAHVEEHGHRHRPRADPRARRQLRGDVGRRARAPPGVSTAPPSPGVPGRHPAGGRPETPAGRMC